MNASIGRPIGSGATSARVRIEVAEVGLVKDGDAYVNGAHASRRSRSTSTSSSAPAT